MKKQILDILCCPDCKHDLTLIEREVANDEVIDGILRCNNCQKSFNIIKGVPRMIVNLGDRTELAESWGFQWAKRAEKKFETDTLYGMTEEEELNSFFRYLDVAPDDLKGKYILDAGCGSGRLTKMLGKYDAEVFGLDIASSVDYIYEYCKPFKNVNIIQADVLNMPFKNATFDLIWSNNTICYVHDPEYAFKRSSERLKPSGKLYVRVASKDRLAFIVKVRDFLRITPKIPRNLLFYLSYLFAVPLSVVKKMLKKRGTPVKLNAFFLFNAMQPEFFTRHSDDEVTVWFEDENFKDIINLSGTQDGVLVRGTKR